MCGDPVFELPRYPQSHSVWAGRGGSLGRSVHFCVQRPGTLKDKIEEFGAFQEA